MTSCICGKSKPFAKCCEPFLSGKQHAKTPEQLMRSRFSAYALGGHGEYLLSTWLPTSAQGLTAQHLSEKTLNWKRLEVLSSSQQGDNGTVEFKAWFCDTQSPSEEQVMHETSTFLRMGDRWFYVSGKMK